MKYIRTKDGIFEYVDYDNECIIPMPIIKCKDKLTHCAEYDIIKQADTIEELCDEFVVLNPCENNRPMLMTGLFPDIVHNLLHISYAEEGTLDYEEHCFPSELPLDKADVYGAIWTDKGLIYVAKMNEKGELELL